MDLRQASKVSHPVFPANPISWSFPYVLCNSCRCRNCSRRHTASLASCRSLQLPNLSSTRVEDRHAVGGKSYGTNYNVSTERKMHYMNILRKQRTHYVYTFALQSLRDYSRTCLRHRVEDLDITHCTIAISSYHTNLGSIT